jgi:hypothetical protein
MTSRAAVQRLRRTPAVGVLRAGVVSQRLPPRIRSALSARRDRGERTKRNLHPPSRQHLLKGPQ